MVAASVLAVAAAGIFFLAQRLTQGGAPPFPMTPMQGKIVGAARDLTHRRIRATFDYQPGGAPPEDEGACVDVVIRSLRAVGVDLQQLMYVDIGAHPEAYPLYRWNQTRPDRNIDHRRCPNQVAFFKRHALQLTTKVRPNRPDNISQWRGGDIVFWDMSNPGEFNHVGIVSDRRNRRGVPFVIHHLVPRSVVESNELTRWKIVAHFRYPKAGSG